MLLSKHRIYGLSTGVVIMGEIDFQDESCVWLKNPCTISQDNDTAKITPIVFFMQASPQGLLELQKSGIVYSFEPELATIDKYQDAIQ